MHFVLLYFMSVAFSKCISCVSRCARELLLLMYIVVSSAKAKVFRSFSPITMPFIPFFYLMFSKNISANITHRIIDNGHSCRSSLFTRIACDNYPFVLICVSMLNCFHFLYYFGVIIMMMMMVDWRKAFSLNSSRDHYQISSPSRISDTPRAGFEPAQNLSSGLVEWSHAVVITTTPRRQLLHGVTKT